MKTPREILLETHQAALPALDRLRAEVVDAELGKMAAIARQPAWENPQHNFAAAIGLKLWNELIWPSRRTWGALAAVWVVLAIINISNRMSFQTPAQSTESRSPEAFADLGTQQKLLSDLMQNRLPRPPKPSTPVMTAPESGKSAEWIQSEKSYLA